MFLKNIEFLRVSDKHFELKNYKSINNSLFVDNFIKYSNLNQVMP